MPNCDLSAIGPGQATEEIWWQGLTGTLNSNVEQWSEVAGLQNMDLTS